MKTLLIVLCASVVASAQAPMPDLNTRTLEALKLAVKHLESPEVIPTIFYGGQDTLGKLRVRELENYLTAAKQREADIDKIKLALRDLDAVVTTAVATPSRVRVIPPP